MLETSGDIGPQSCNILQAFVWWGGGGGGGGKVYTHHHKSVCKIWDFVDLYLCQFPKYHSEIWHIY